MKKPRTEDVEDRKSDTSHGRFCQQYTDSAAHTSSSSSRRARARGPSWFATSINMAFAIPKGIMSESICATWIHGALTVMSATLARGLESESVTAAVRRFILLAVIMLSRVRLVYRGKLIPTTRLFFDADTR